VDGLSVKPERERCEASGPGFAPLPAISPLTGGSYDLATRRAIGCGSSRWPLTGLSQSPVVGAVLPGILTLAGGSVLALSVAEATSDADQQLLGQQMLAVVIGTAIGVFVGLCLVSRNIKLPILRP